MKAKTFLVCALRKAFPLLLTAMVCAACAEGAASFNAAELKVPGSRVTETPVPEPLTGAGPGSNAEASLSLEQIAELERAGSYFPGLGLTESVLREKAADYAGAAIAAYKELSWAYSYGSASKEQVQEGLQNVLTLMGKSQVFGRSASDAVRGCAAFANGDWEKAEEFLTQLASGLQPGLQEALPADKEPDSFLRWMLLVCSLEQEENVQAARQAYSAIRARYTMFPEYWYRGAKAFSANESIAASYAEHCVNISPRGPFAEDCRKIIAGHLGFSPNDRDLYGDIYSHIKTRAEIENIIRNSVSANRPAILEDLYPLMTLPENPYTLYTMGALRALAAVPEFKSFFLEGAGKQPGRLSERLSYIARG